MRFMQFKTILMQKKTSALSIIFLVLFIFIVSIFAVNGNFLVSEEGKRTHIILHTSDGFEPQTTVISRGDTVRFVTEVSEGFWPASDPHPTHDSFSEFDPQKVINKGDAWEYTFDRIGTWEYHNHIGVADRGTVVVTGGEGIFAALTSFFYFGKEGYCSGVCFDKKVKEAVRESGIEAGYQLLNEAFQNDALPPSCHWTAHQIGEAAYDIFKEGKEITVTKETEYCGFGFYHGFMESLLRENPDTTQALKFCEQVDSQLGDNALQNCYHGIGHGFTEDPPDPLHYGEFQKMIEPGIEICEFLFNDNFRNLNLCLTGVFTVPVGFAEKNKHGLALDHKDPFSLCDGQPYRYQKACYGEVAPKLASLLEWDISKLPPYLKGFTNPHLVELVTFVVPATSVSRYVSEDSHEQFMEGCLEGFKGKVKDVCIAGVILGFFIHEEPDKQYEPAFRFCSLDGFSSKDRLLCYQETVRMGKDFYSPEIAREMCLTLPSDLRGLCSRDDHKSPYQDYSFDTEEPFDPLYVEEFVIFNND